MCAESSNAQGTYARVHCGGGDAGRGTNLCLDCRHRHKGGQRGIGRITVMAEDAAGGCISWSW
jgi:hypothetical protein